MALEWLSTVLEKKLGVRPTIGQTGPITEGSHGYMAQIRRIELQWPVDRADLPKSVVIKCPVAGSAADAWLDASGDMDAEERAKAAAEKAKDMKKVQELCHAAESQVYGLFDENYPAPCPIPKTYASFGISHDHPSIIMEDITGATITDIVDGWTDKQVYTILDSIVNIHVMSFTTEKWKTVEIEEDDDMMETFSQMAKTFATEILKRNPLPSLEKVSSHILKDSSWFKGMYKKFADHPLSVLVHGDMWAPQFLWRGDTLAAIVDWQLTHKGSIMEDFLRLVPLGVSSSDKIRLTPTLLNYYYTQLNSKLEAKGFKIPFTYQEMMEEYKSSLPYACGMAVFAFGMWSNSPVLKKGDSGDEGRISEMYSRMASLLDECVHAYGW
uniref:CHK kinase-like domain-containing protein n=1 Tax=Pristionchus pacificus TaxID=54126 RepID=A0A8R1YHD0_PRIPA